MMEEYEEPSFLDRFLSGYFPGICLCLSPILIIVAVLWLN